MSMLRITIAGALASAAMWAAGPIAAATPSAASSSSRANSACSATAFRARAAHIAPDLSKRIDRDYTPAVMASLMWNHAPAMWSAMKSKGIVKSEMTPEIAADLFAYFVSARFFDRPGDAGRGKQLFAARHCADCHGLTTQIAGGGPPVAKWGSLVDPLALAEQMWNHGPAMRAAYAQKKLHLESANRAGTQRHPGVPAESARDARPAAPFRFPAIPGRRAVVSIEGLHRVPQGSHGDG